MAVGVPFPRKGGHFFLKGKIKMENNELFQDEVLTAEIAEQEFNRMLKSARVRWNVYETVHGKRDVEADRMIVIDALQYGQIELNDEGFPTVNTNSDVDKLKRLVMKGRKSVSKWLMTDRIPEGQDVKKL